MASLGSHRSLPRFLACCCRSRPAGRNECSSSCNVLYYSDMTEPRTSPMYGVDQRAKINEGPLTTTADTRGIVLMPPIMCTAPCCSQSISGLTCSFSFRYFFNRRSSCHGDHTANSLRPSSQVLCTICCTTLPQGHFFVPIMAWGRRTGGEKRERKVPPVETNTNNYCDTN